MKKYPNWKTKTCKVCRKRKPLKAFHHYGHVDEPARYGTTRRVCKNCQAKIKSCRPPKKNEEPYPPWERQLITMVLERMDRALKTGIPQQDPMRRYHPDGKPVLDSIFHGAEILRRKTRHVATIHCP